MAQSQPKLAIEELNEAINTPEVIAFEATINRLRPAFVNDENMSTHLRALAGTLARTRGAIVLPQPAPEAPAE